MWKLLSLSIIQSALLAGGQVFLKFAMMRMPAFGWTRQFWGSLLVNWQFAACGLFFALGSLLWMYIMVSLSYVFGMLAAIIFFHEDVSVTRWIGVLLIMGGCVLIAK